eukprot:CAMPEP_0181179914 /NCGR_PEP_ID=MMETSP1096-20121128/6518_1 /TAXON_ID=156174 ORGANISM="Chrysochromulina ericina, Strain CCMP281" /NCGR_SAMPLE_ID=MMETSP1096 /ASSEMBLY_ACC=CAM_ASM_000453 /LENGTH=103 /DNA_ID=CAMNT_0023268303 /DNA_START=89 /DNA_END=400 /DNA_ORIENTATION=+
MMMRWTGAQHKEDLSMVNVFFAGGMAGCVGWSLIIPLDVVKTRLQTGSAHGSVPRVMASIVAAEGGLALFSGWTAAVVRAFPANAGLFLGVEVSIRAMKRWLD